MWCDTWSFGLSKIRKKSVENKCAEMIGKNLNLINVCCCYLFQITADICKIFWRPKTFLSRLKMTISTEYPPSLFLAMGQFNFWKCIPSPNFYKFLTLWKILQKIILPPPFSGHDIFSVEWKYAFSPFISFMINHIFPQKIIY